MSKKNKSIKYAYRIENGDIKEKLTAKDYFRLYIETDKEHKGDLVCASCYDTGKKDNYLYVHGKKDKETVRFNQKKSNNHSEKCKDVIADEERYSACCEILNRVSEYSMGICNYINEEINCISFSELNRIFDTEDKNSVLNSIKEKYGEQALCLYGKIDRIDNSEEYETIMYIKLAYANMKSIVSIRLIESDKNRRKVIEDTINRLRANYEPIIAIAINVGNIKILNNGKNVNVDINTLYQEDVLMICGKTLRDFGKNDIYLDKYRKKTYNSFLHKAMAKK